MLVDSKMEKGAANMVGLDNVKAGSFLRIGCQKLRGEKYQISRRRRTSSSIRQDGPLRYFQIGIPIVISERPNRKMILWSFECPILH